ncbi:hypothetical protein K3H43_21385 [Aeromonas veronii]|uniref:hypothetical protein n=1 Tax=Aeromonas veronii TaxID=654 RepID=UPI001F3D65C6|nr:hypothetical protein [Aeromonas veronii]MCF5729902.1 hypothetical protein [Aeromonas veronii]
MPTQWIDVVDSAIKIGLGALISGIATYKISALNHSKDVHKSIINKKISMLEEISVHAEEYFYFCTMFSNTVRGARHCAINKGEPLTESQLEMFISTQAGLNDVLSSRNKAISKIKILSIPAAEEAVNAHNDALNAFREIVFFDKKMPTDDDIETYISQRMINVDKFYKAIGDYMDSIIS